MGSKSTCGSFKIPTGLQKLHLQRHMKLKNLLYSYVLEEKGPATRKGAVGEEHPEIGLNQAHGEPERERE